MDSSPIDIMAVVNGIVKSLLVNTCVESFGVMHHMTFHPQRHEILSQDERILLGMNSVNLKRVIDAYCTDKADLEVHFEDGSWFRVVGTTEDGYEPWQLSDGGKVAEGGKLLIASSGDANYAVWA